MNFLTFKYSHSFSSGLYDSDRYRERERNRPEKRFVLIHYLPSSNQLFTLISFSISYCYVVRLKTILYFLFSPTDIHIHIFSLFITLSFESHLYSSVLVFNVVNSNGDTYYR